MRAWLTPDEPPGTLVAKTVYCPAGVLYEAALRGAIFLLTEVKNWEKFGAQDAETVAQAFFDAMTQSLGDGL